VEEQKMVQSIRFQETVEMRFRLSALLLCSVFILGCDPAPSEPAKQQPDGPDTPTSQTTNANPTTIDLGSSAPVKEESKPATEVPFVHPLSAEEQADGWIALFDGHSLFGWSSNTEDADEKVNWTVQDGTITADSGPSGLLLTSVPFSDYEIVCEFRMAAGGNSGLFLRSIESPKDVALDSYEVNIADSHPGGYTTGSLVNRQKTESPITGSGDWQTMHVTILGSKVTVKVNGDTVLEHDAGAEAKKSGLIGLQKNSGKIEFRKVALKPIAMTELFNGTDLTGWVEVPGSKSEFTVADQQIHCKNGLGFIETADTFGDFLFQADSITHADELNSGYFFRAMKGTEEAPSNGYEVQIHNGIKDGDPTKPANAGTGAIFRRVDARRVVCKDKEWCTTTLVANGQRIAVWVNGYQVTDWMDERKPDDNPRKGSRVKPGHISLQGHDPTTDLSFRKLRIQPALQE